MLHLKQLLQPDLINFYYTPDQRESFDSLLKHVKGH